MLIFMHNPCVDPSQSLRWPFQAWWGPSPPWPWPPSRPPWPATWPAPTAPSGGRSPLCTRWGAGLPMAQSLYSRVEWYLKYLYAIFENGHYAADQVYFYESNSKNQQIYFLFFILLSFVWCADWLRSCHYSFSVSPPLRTFPIVWCWGLLSCLCSQGCDYIGPCDPIVYVGPPQILHKLPEPVPFVTTETPVFSLESQVFWPRGHLGHISVWNDFVEKWGLPENSRLEKFYESESWINPNLPWNIWNHYLFSYSDHLYILSLRKKTISLVIVF